MTATAVLDRYGYPLSTPSVTAAEHYNLAIERVLAGSAGQEEALASALAADDGFALAHVAQARMHQYRGRLAEARTSAARARELAAGTSRREQGHVAAVAASIDGDNPRAASLIREHLDEYPRDAYLLSQMTGPFSLIGFGGGPDWRRECFALLAPLAPAYGEDWWFLSAFAFLHNELEQFAEARDLAERSLKAYPRSAHTAHTVAHIAFETGDSGGGSSFLEAWMPGYPREGQMFGHLTWHHALFELAAGRYQRVLALYDSALRPSAATGAAIITMADAAAMLWRCDIYGYHPGAERWKEVRDFGAAAFARPGVTFADLHYALAYAAAADEQGMGKLIDGLRARVAEGRLPAGEVAPALAEGIAAFAHGDYAGMIRLVEPLQDEIVRVGGSNAQRQVFEDTLLEAYLRAGAFDKAEALLHARLARRHSPRDAYQLGVAEAGQGRPDAARASLTRAREGWRTADAGNPEVAAVEHALAALPG